MSLIDQFQGDAGRKRRRGRFRQAASEKPGGALAGRYPHRTAQHRRSRRAPPLQRQHRILDTLGRRDQLLAGGVEVQPLGQAVEQGRPAKSGLERGQSAGDGRLAEPERPPGGTHRALPGNGEEHPDIVPVHRPAIRSRWTGRRLMSRLAPGNCRSVESSHDTPCDAQCADSRRPFVS